MSKKWMKVDPATLKVGDEVKVKHDYLAPLCAKVSYVTVSAIGVGPYDFYPCAGTWYIRKPKKAKPLKDTYYAELEAEVKALKAERDELRETLDELDAALLAPSPPTRPDEPPVGTFFRVDRTGFEFWRFASMEDGYGYWQISPRSEEPDWERWDDITEPGDTITRLLLVEATDD